MSSSTLNDLPIERLLKINEVCNRFERALRDAPEMGVDEFLTEVIEADRPILRAELEAIRGSRGEDQPPREIGEYVLEAELGRGGMGRVYRAVHRTMKRPVAIKFSYVSAAHQQVAADQRFQREVEILGRLQHPNVVTAFDAGRSGAWRYLVTELIDGIDLSRWVRQDGPMTFPQAIDVLEQVCLGLEYLHGQGVVHRDLKPANIMLDRAGRVRILDVGLARAHSDDAGKLTQTSLILGTADYMAPEQADSPRDVDAPTDLYALGCTLYYLLRGQPPYSGRSAFDVVMAHRQFPIPDLEAGSPPALDELFRKLLAKRPSDRVGSAAEVLAQLRGIRGTGDPPTAVITAPTPPRRRRMTWLAAAALVMVSLVVLGYAIFRRNGGQAPPSVADYPLSDPAGYQQQWARHLGLPVVVTDKTELTFAFIPPGRFMMGTPDHELRTLRDAESNAEVRTRIEAETSRRVEIAKPFYLGTTEVAVGQFRRFIRATERKTQAEGVQWGWGVENGEWLQKDGFTWRDYGEQSAADNIPVINITCDEAEAYCQWLNGISTTKARYRLPTEAEWEYACRAGTADDREALQRVAWFNANSKRRLQPVATRHANSFGLYDMLGNHAEWCGIPDRSSPLFTPIPDAGPTDRPSRGGSFFEAPERIRPAARDWAPGNTLGKGGFRVLKEFGD